MADQNGSIPEEEQTGRRWRSARTADYYVPWQDHQLCIENRGINNNYSMGWSLNVTLSWAALWGQVSCFGCLL